MRIIVGDFVKIIGDQYTGHNGIVVEKDKRKNLTLYYVAIISDHSIPLIVDYVEEELELVAITAWRFL